MRACCAQIQRLLLSFGVSWHQANPDVFGHPDGAQVVANAALMAHTSLYNNLALFDF